MRSEGAALVPRGAARPGFGVGWVVRDLVAHVEALGLDAATIRQLPGLRGRRLDDPDALFPERALDEAWRLATMLTRDDALGLHLAEQLPQGALDLIEYAFRASCTLRAAAERFARYARLLNDRLAARVLAESGSVHFLVCEPDGRPLDRQRAELTLALVLRLARDTTALAELTPMEVSFAHAAPSDASEHRRIFRAPVRFSAAVSELVFSGPDADGPLRSADEALGRAIHWRLERLLGEQGGPAAGSLASRVRQEMIAGMGPAVGSAARVARVLGLSERTLSRRLAQEGVSFRVLQDRVRHETATALLNDPGLSIAEIAFVLGYSEPAAFHRSFKRWTGRTPLAYRRGRPAS